MHYCADLNPCTDFVVLTTQREREMAASACSRSMPGYYCKQGANEWTERKTERNR